MATRSWASYHRGTTTAEFLSWAKGISDSFAAFGWTREAIAGSIDWATVAAPAAGASAGFEVWRTGGARPPIYVRIEYRAQTSQSPDPRIQTGSAIDAAGNLTGISKMLAQRSMLSSTAVSPTLSTSMASGDTDRIAVFLTVDNASISPIGFLVERSRDDNGAYSNDGWTTMTLPTSWTEYVPFGSAPPTGHSLSVAMPTGLQTMVYQNESPVSPGLVFKGRLMPPSIGWMFYLANDYPDLSVNSIEVYGVPRTYTMIGRAGSGINPAGSRPALLWE